MKSCLIKLLKCVVAMIATLCVLILGIYVYLEWKDYYASSSLRVERITGVRVPPYKIIECNKGRRGFNGDYNDIYIIEFESMPSDELFDEIDKKIAEGSMGWRKNGNDYNFSAMWGNGLPAPKGESEEDDGMFSITMTKGSKKGEIRNGAW